MPIRFLAGSCVNVRAMTRRIAELRRFREEEEGGLIVLTLFLLVTMLVMGGMAVDFMRFEARRALLQSVSDRAVLAAANLNQTADSTTARNVVIDYFTKAGFEDTIIGTPTVSGNASNRSVSVNAELDLNTFYLRLIGIDQLEAPARSAAVQGSGAVEISLILDVSGSMYSYVSGTEVRKIDRLQEAATSFVNKLMVPDYEDQISISLVPYSEHVNIGPDLFGAINTSSALGMGIGEVVVDPVTGAVLSGGNPNPALCVEIPDAEYETTVFNDGITYAQSQMWQSNTWGKGGWSGTPGNRTMSNSALDQPLCPNNVAEQIIPISQNKTALTDAIDGLEPRGGTSIFLGLKWGVTLLDPSFRPIIQSLDDGVIDDAFEDTRPTNFPLTDPEAPKTNYNDPNSQTVKYIVLMTDGQNSQSSRIRDDYYNSAAEIERWATYNLPYMYWAAWQSDPALSARFADFKMSWSALRTKYVRDGFYTESQGDTLMQNMCTAARARNITVFTIAMDAQPHGQEEMRECASKPSDLFYFSTSGDELVAIFDAIAEQIVALRLTF